MKVKQSLAWNFCIGTCCRSLDRTPMNSHCSKVGSLTVEIVPIAKDAHWHQNDYLVRLAVGVLANSVKVFIPWSKESMMKHVVGEWENLVYD